jgi:hypothetical protein
LAEKAFPHVGSPRRLRVTYIFFCGFSPLAPPLRKRKLDGVIYFRPVEIEAKLEELEHLPRDELLERCQIGDRSDPKYVPSECVVHFVRGFWRDNNEARFEKFYRVGRSIKHTSGQVAANVSFISQRLLGKWLNQLAIETYRQMDMRKFGDARGADRSDTFPVCTDNLNAGVAMMKSAQDGA